MAEPSQQDIIKALDDRDVGVLRGWIESGVLPAADWRDATGDTLLHYAAEWDAPGFSRFLLKAGAVASVFGAAGTPRDTALAWDHGDTAEVLQEAETREAAAKSLSFPATLAAAQTIPAADEFSVFYKTVKTGGLPHILSLAKDGGLRSEDFLRQQPNGDTALIALAQRGEARLLLQPQLWQKRPDDAARLWSALPKTAQEGIDYQGFTTRLRQMRVQRAVRTRFKLDK